MLNIVLFGPPGAGKGTQSDLIEAKYKLVHISTGDLLRAEIKAQTDLGLYAQSLIDKGNFVPDEVAIEMISNKIDANKGVTGFIFDGFPRTKIQAEALDVLMAQNNMGVSCMISLDVENEVLVERLLARGKISGRPDDQSEEIILTRIEAYHTKTEPVKVYYNGQSKLHEIKGVGSIEEIFEDISKVCDLFA